MKQITQFPKDTTHALARLISTKGVSVALWELKGNKIYETITGAEVLKMPWICKNYPGDPSGYWPILGYYNEQDGQVARKAIVEEAKRSGQKIVRNFGFDEQKILGEN